MRLRVKPHVFGELNSDAGLLTYEDHIVVREYLKIYPHAMDIMDHILSTILFCRPTSGFYGKIQAKEHLPLVIFPVSLDQVIMEKDDGNVKYIEYLSKMPSMQVFEDWDDILVKTRDNFVSRANTDDGVDLFEEEAPPETDEEENS